MSHRQESSVVIALRDVTRMEAERVADEAAAEETRREAERAAEEARLESERRHQEELRAAVDEANRRHTAERLRLQSALETATFRAGELTVDLDQARTALAALRDQDRPRSATGQPGWALACVLAWLCAAGFGAAMLLRKPPVRVVTVEVPAAAPIILPTRPVAPPVVTAPDPPERTKRPARPAHTPQKNAAPPSVFTRCDGDPLCGLTDTPRN